MKLLLGVVGLVLLFSWTVMAEPLAHVPLNKSYVKKTGLSEKDLVAKMKIPSKEEVGAPVYPGAYYFQSNKGIGDKLLTVVLITRDTPEKVQAWYKEKNTGKTKIEIKPFTLYEWMTQLMDIADMKSEIWIHIQ